MPTNSRATRTIYYLGNKTRSAPQIAEACHNFSKQGEFFLDLFAGSGSISSELSKYGAVASNDVQTYSRHVCEALLISSSSASEGFRSWLLGSSDLKQRIELLSEKYDDFLREEFLIACQTADGEAGTELKRSQMIQRIMERADAASPIIGLYGGVYFTVKDACVLQAVADKLVDLTEGPKSIAKACLISAASRCSVTVGNQFAQPQKFSDKTGAAKTDAGRVYLSALSKELIRYMHSASFLYPARNRVSGSNICLQDVDSVIASSHSRQAKLVYLDPPYGREHYSRFYHVLEAIAVGKFTEDTSVTRMSNDRFQSDYGRRSRAAKAFEDVLSICSDNGTPVAISYVDESQGSAVANRIIPVDTVRSAVRSRYSKFTEIEVSTKNYSQLNRVDGKDRRKGREILIVGHS